MNIDKGLPPSYEAAANMPTAAPQTAPPVNPPPIPGASAYPAQPPAQMYMTHPPQTVIIQPMQPNVIGQNIIVVHQIKAAPSFDPYMEVCPYCQSQVVTRRRFVMGSMVCLFIFLSLFCFPFIFFICCTSFHDAHHYCPNCNRLIAIKKR